MTTNDTPAVEPELDGAWKSRAAAASELSVVRGERVTVARIYGWKKQGAPIPRNGPIPKGPLVEWLIGLAEPGFKAPDRSAEEEELRRQLLVEQVRHLQAKNEVLEGSRIDATQVSRGILSACATLKATLATDLPVRFVEAIRGMPVETAVDEVRRMLQEAVNRWCDDAHASTGAPQGEPEAAG
jgi:hypothetical protein